MLMTATFGGAVAQPLSVWLQELVTWRWMFVIFASFGFVWAGAWYVWFRDDPHAHPGVNAAELSLIGSPPPTPHQPVPWRVFAGNSNLWLICLMYFSTIYGSYFYVTWLPEYLQTRRGFDLRSAGWLGALALVGMGIGNVLGGWASDVGSKRWGRRLGRRLPGMLGPPLAAVAILAAMWTTHGFASAAALCCGGRSDLDGDPASLGSLPRHRRPTCRCHGRHDDHLRLPGGASARWSWESAWIATRRSTRHCSSMPSSPSSGASRGS